MTAVDIKGDETGTLSATLEPWEFKLVFKAARRLRRAFPQKPYIRVVNELLKGLLTGRRVRERLNLNHWPKHGPRFIESLAQLWKVRESKRIEAIPAFLMMNRKEALKLALAITNNLPDAEIAVAESEFEHLISAVGEEQYPASVQRNALEMVKKRQTGEDFYLPLEQAFEAGDKNRTRKRRKKEKPKMKNEATAGAKKDGVDRLKKPANWKRILTYQPIKAVEALDELRGKYMQQGREVSRSQLITEGINLLAQAAAEGRFELKA